MNLKERGITVGDLLIIIIILTTTILIKNYNKDNKTGFNLSNHEEMSYKKISLSKNHLNFFSV